MIAKTSKFTVFTGPPAAQIIDATAPVVPKKPCVRSSLGPQYEECQDRFEAIFGDISNETACKASLGDRKVQKKSNDTTLTYGELDSMAPIWKVFSKLIKDFSLLEANSTDVAAPWKYYDLGSGSGRPVIAAALTLQDHQSNGSTVANHSIQCIGIEILPSLYELSIQARDKWNNAFNTHVSNLNSDDDNVATIRPMHVEFVLGSIFDLDVCNWTDGDFVFVNSTCFDMTMMLRLYDMSTNMKKGSILVTLSRSMVDVGSLARNIRDKCVSEQVDPPLWRLLFESREVMSW